jgi:hypothetical protein
MSLERHQSIPGGGGIVQQDSGNLMSLSSAPSTPSNAGSGSASVAQSVQSPTVQHHPPNPPGPPYSSQRGLVGMPVQNAGALGPLVVSPGSVSPIQSTSQGISSRTNNSGGGVVVPSRDAGFFPSEPGKRSIILLILISSNNY